VIGTPAEALDMPVTSIRPIPFHGLWRLGVLARVWQGRVLDKLRL
ncbi:MAG: FAD-dependent oxidoreductase, partial [Rhodospirillales bacterium]|nr:FAD-dependent oxidoreductase [Rhodospirillales bacterium]